MLVVSKIVRLDGNVDVDMQHKAAQANRHKCTSASRQHDSSAVSELDPPLLLKRKEACRVLGGIHPRTLARLESRGLIRAVSGLLRHKLYARRDVEALVENMSSWNP